MTDRPYIPDPALFVCGPSRDHLYAMLSESERVAVRMGQRITDAPPSPDHSLGLRRQCLALWRRLDEMIAAKRQAERDQKARRMKRRHDAARKGRAA